MALSHKQRRSLMPLRDWKKQSKSAIRRRIIELFDLARAASKESLELATQYVKRARSISLATRVPIPRELRRRMCKECGAYLISGKNATIRTQRGKVVIRCEECKEITRIPYVAERKARRQLKSKSVAR